MSQVPRQPPSFVPTLTQMVQSPESAAPAEPVLQASAAMPAVFAELLKDWPALGEPAELAEPRPALDKDLRNASVEQIARRAEALVMQRLPALMAGLVSQAVLDAMNEVEANDRKL